jgi:hypothetical protein
VRSTAAPYTESRLTRSVANERVGFPVVEHRVQQPTISPIKPGIKIFFFVLIFTLDTSSRIFAEIIVTKCFN